MNLAARKEARRRKLANEAQMFILIASTVGTYVLLIMLSKPFRLDNMKMFKFKMTSAELVVRNPLSAALILFSFLVPLAVMKLL